ncbi:hypothetical protein QYM36_017208 [Artemia franciscana]|uniref:mRNA-decapping enzyme 2 n=1 Tax=Artemia franciscana TaxID=6661 RepID=A0AA88KWW6_ARTSF|nr:hypothetical protein QYM36_017208 [Artemia franciscana]
MSNEGFTHLLEKYIFSMPEKDTKNLNKVCQQIQLVNWALFDSPNKEDYSPHMTWLRKLKYKEFMRYVFNKVEFLRKDITNVDTIYNEWQKYCRLIPTYGCILVNKRYDKVLLVKVFGSNSGWSFPKGKIEENESELECAVREVFEETGYRCNRRRIDLNRYIDLGKQNSYSRYCKLFIVYDVNEEFNFKPKSKYEITDIKWHSISEIFNKIDAKQFRLVQPYMDRLLSKVKSQKVTHQRYKIKSKLNTTNFGSRVFCPAMAYNCGGNQAFPPHSVTFIDCIFYVFKDKMLFRIPLRFTKKTFQFYAMGRPLLQY